MKIKNSTTRCVLLSGTLWKHLADIDEECSGHSGMGTFGITEILHRFYVNHLLDFT